MLALHNGNIGAMRNQYIYIIGFLLCLLLLSEAYYLQYVKNILPCLLCIMQRLVYYILAVIFLIATVHNPYKLGQRVYATLIFSSALIGAGFSLRQIYLQQLPFEKAPPCTPSLNFMLHNFPLQRVIKALFYGSGNCTVVHTRILRWDLAEWSLLFFVIFTIIAIVLFLKTKPAK